MHKSVERELLELEALVNKKLKENAKLINISVHPSYEEKQFMPYIGCFTLKIKGKTANGAGEQLLRKYLRRTGRIRFERPLLLRHRIGSRRHSEA